MNCANHPEIPAVAYCQFCGKPLCAQCVHKVNKFVGCAPCLEARVAAGTAGAYGGANAGPGSPGAPWAEWQPHPWGTDPWVAFGLGWIPGVGAMYNGQFAKGLAHVLIFALLVNMTHMNGGLGILVAAWVFYQVFDAYHTARARRDGLPLPNPLGLNNIGQWFGVRPPANGNPSAPAPPAAGPAAEPPAPGPASGFAAGYTPPSSAPPYTAPPYTAPPMPPIPPIPPSYYRWHDDWHRGGGVPAKAVILIVLGALFLLGNFGILNQNWLNRGWPILLIALGVWLVIRHHTPPPTGGVR